ncbi:MAG: Rrf2 family transcriptional regulator [Bryobacteraceae bacterium]|nr:Rrf2 family transcriptional regulator [Bryobacteraceae bacterium]
MKLSAQEEYGLRCLLYMARHGETRSHSIPEISRAEGLSVPNVAKLMRILRLGGLVASVRGQAGGYTLSRTSERISVAEVLSLLGGSFYSEQFCTRHSGLERACAHAGDCSVRLLWRTVQQALDGILEKTTLRDLLKPEPEMTDFLKSLTFQSEPVEEPVASHVNGY